jgi:hypothetical protein
MTVVLLLYPKINFMTIPPVVPVNSFRTIPSCGSLLELVDIIFSAFHVYFYHMLYMYNLAVSSEWMVLV